MRTPFPHVHLLVQVLASRAKPASAHLLHESDCSVPYATPCRFWHSMLSLLQPVDRFAFSTCFNAEAWPSGHDLKPCTIFPVRLVPSSCCSVHVLQPSVQWPPCPVLCLSSTGRPSHIPFPFTYLASPVPPISAPPLRPLDLPCHAPSSPTPGLETLVMAAIGQVAELRMSSFGLGWLPVGGRASTGLVAPFCGSCALIPTHLC